MNRFLLILSALLALAEPILAQTSTDLGEGARIVKESSNTYTFRWWGQTGRTYFVRSSPDLFTWVWLTDIVSGAGKIVTPPIGFSTTSDRYFMRLKYTNQLTDDPANSDFDGDGVSNADELSRNLDPLTDASNRDLDGDGLPDDWERFWFTVTTSHNGSEPGGDGFTVAEKFKFGLNPTVTNESVTSAKDLSYDALGRLQTAGAVTYSYDAEGNIQTAGQ